MSARQTTAAGPARNPGPSWGYRFLRLCDRLLPEFLFKPLRIAGTIVAWAFMPVQRRHSREYLSLILPRPPTAGDVFRHFLAFEEALMEKLRIANGRDIPCDYDPTGKALEAWLSGGGPILLGTFHVGVSDMLGFQLGCREKQRVHIVRRRVGNSHDTDRLAAISGGRVHFIWANDPFELIFAMKEAAESGDAIAMQCDRVENAIRTEAFDFLGARRRFPMTIYRLAPVLKRPVILAVGVVAAGGRSRLYGSPRFDTLSGESRSQALERAKAHFQEFLALVERLLREQPYVWFNFIPMNPVAGAESDRRAAP